MSRQTGSPRSVVVERSERVLERTAHLLEVPAGVTDDRIVAWALERAASGQLPPAFAERTAIVDAAGPCGLEVSAITHHQDGDSPRRATAFTVRADEDPAVLTLCFVTPDLRVLALRGLAAAQLTYDWLRLGDTAEQLVRLGHGSTIELQEGPVERRPSWAGRFQRCARALGGRFSRVEICQPPAATTSLWFSLSAGNEDNPDLTIGRTSPAALPAGARVTAGGLTACNGMPLALYDRRTGYWSLPAGAERYSDVLIHPPA